MKIKTLSLLFLSSLGVCSLYFFTPLNSKENPTKNELQKKVVSKVKNVCAKASHTTTKKPSISEKKRHFFQLVVPEVQRVYKELSIQYARVKKDIALSKNTNEIKELKKLYRVTSDEALLLALKPHPVSIVIAQAAVESAWATSRFSLEANNFFGMWSINAEESRVAASEKRGGKRTIWLKKFPTIEDSIRDYYLTIGRVKVYKKLREYRMQTDDVYEIIKGLNRYSELGEEYVKIIRGVISYNKLTKYDSEVRILTQ